MVSELSAREIAGRIREKVQDLNDELILAAGVDLDVEFVVSARNLDEWEPVNIRVFLRQEV